MDVKSTAGEDPIMHQFDEKPPASWLFALIGRLWVRVLLIGIVLLVVAGTVYYKTAVVPTLTATRFEVSVEGRGNRLVIGVDDEAGVVTVSGGQNGLSELVISDGSLMVLVSEVGVDGGEYKWVEVPLSMVDARWGEIVTACVIGPASTESALRQACEALEPAARPRRYVFVPSIPTNASGKPDREAIAKLTA